MLGRLHEIVGGVLLKKYIEWVLVLLVFSVISAFFMGKSLTSCSDVVINGPGDHTAGLIYVNFTHPNKPWPGYTQLTNYPIGENHRSPISMTTQVPSIVHWVISQTTNLVCGWNIMVLLGYLANAILMYSFIRWLTKNKYAAFFGAYALAFSPYHVFSSKGQIAGMFGGLFIIALWLFLHNLEKPRLLKGVALGTILGIGFYTDGYFILIGGVMLLAFWISTLSFVALHKCYNLKVYKTQLLSLFAASMTALTFLLPLVWVQKNYSKEINQLLSNARGNITIEAQTYSAHIKSYVTPNSVIYLGIICLLLSLFYLYGFQKNTKGDNQRSIKLIKSREFGWVIIILTITAFLFSLQPSLYIAGIKIYTPTFLVISLTSIWRVFGRLYILVSIGVITMASLGLKTVLEKYPKYKAAVFIVVMTVLIAEMSIYPTVNKNVYFNYRDSPAIYSWAKSNDSIRAIAEYPLLDPSEQAAYFTYLQISNKPIINANLYNGPQMQLKQAILGLNDPQTIPILRRLGADLINVRPVVVDGMVIDVAKSIENNQNLEKVILPGQLTKGLDSFIVKPGPASNYALVFMPSEGFRTFAKKDATTDYLTPKDINLKLDLLPSATSQETSTISFKLRSEHSRYVTITQNGKYLWSNTINASNQQVQLSVSTKYPISVHMEQSNKLNDLVFSSLEVMK